MENRGTEFGRWFDPDIDCMRHVESLGLDVQIEVLSRLSWEICTQLFVGVYTAEGLRIHEHYYENRDGEHLSQALEWGKRQARLIAKGYIMRAEQSALD